MSAKRKPDAALRVPGGRPSIGPTSGDPRPTLASLLEMAFGGAVAANAAVAQALAVTGRQELPATGPEVLAFVRAHLLRPLNDEIGPRLTMALLDDLVDQLEGEAFRAPPDAASQTFPVTRSAIEPGSAPRVRAVRFAALLVDADRVGRTTLARAMLRAGWDVTLVDTLADVVLALEEDAPIDAVLVDAAHVAARAIVAELARSRPDVALVARSVDPGRARALLGLVGSARVTVCSREATAEELIDALKKAVRE